MEVLKKIQKYDSKFAFRLIMTALMLSIISMTMLRKEASAAQATLSWNPPTTYSDGSPVTAIGGYKIHTGTASGNYSQNIDVGNVTSYTLNSLNDATTYYFAVTAYDTAGSASGYSNQATFTTPAPPPPTAVYTLTASAGSGGSITPSGVVAISQGLNQSYTISPNSGYTIAGVTVDGVPVGAVGTYTFSNINANHTITASFAAAVTSYSISASTGTGGTISPAGTNNVNYGTSMTFTVAPSTGYRIADVKVDGVSVGAVGTYTFSNINANHTIAASFAAAVTSYSISASTGTGGTISPVGTNNVNYGTSMTFTVAPSTGYRIAEVKVDGVSVGAVGTYTFSNINANHSIRASFRRIRR